jgi:hypothetical protein
MDPKPDPGLSSAPGRTCPIRYHYGPRAIAEAPTRQAEVLYVIGGLYGNAQALATIQEMLAEESAAGLQATACFNGDFNWFDIADSDFLHINQAVAQHDAIAGNVEAELASDSLSAGCGCAYPEEVSDLVVARSNRIFERLHKTALKYQGMREYFASLPMFARYQIGTSHVGVVHGDYQSLAGWGFDVSALHDEQRRDDFAAAFASAKVNVFASSHTCLPGLKVFNRGQGSIKIPVAVINNGAAGMANFRDTQFGVITRIGLTPAKKHALHSAQVGALFVESLRVNFDHQAWTARFVENWPEGSDAYESYFERICHGPGFNLEQAYALR